MDENDGRFDSDRWAGAENVGSHPPQSGYEEVPSSIVGRMMAWLRNLRRSEGAMAHPEDMPEPPREPVPIVPSPWEDPPEEGGAGGSASTPIDSGSENEPPSQEAGATPVERPAEIRPRPKLESASEHDEDPTVLQFPKRGAPVHRATLQMLPGRLLPVNAKIVQQEIRFLRSADREHSVTLGWEEGEPPDHVTLHHPSIQLRHARMEYRRGHWWIQSLVDDDPVLLNGRPLHSSEGRRHMKNGDLVRLGQAEFRFLMP